MRRPYPPHLLAAASSSQAQWTVTNLHAPGMTSSQALSVDNGQQVGNFGSLWYGTPESRINLTPAGSLGTSFIWCVSGGQQVGRSFIAAQTHASLWSGTAASHIDLHPAGAIRSEAYGVHNGQQVGEIGFTNGFRAVIWSGSAAYIDLHPAVAGTSRARAIYNGEQVGEANINSKVHAALWHGTAASFIDLDPPVGDYSVAHGTDGIQQVGSVAYFGTETIHHAALWSGSAASYVDLHPAGAYASGARTVRAGMQVGFAAFGSYANGRAGYWTGTAASWTSLHDFLPPEFSQSAAHGIWTDGNATYIVGNAQNTATQRLEAILWTRYSCYANCDASTVAPTLTANDFVCFLTRFVASDPYANCDAVGGLTANDFICFQTKYAAGCS